MAGEPVVELKDRRLCSECVKDEYLLAKIRSDGQDGKCSYCDLDGKTFSIGQMADEVAAVIEKFFSWVPEDPSNDPESPTGRRRREGRPIAEVIGGLVSHYPAVAADIRQVLAMRRDELESDLPDLDEHRFGPGAHYARRRPIDGGDFEGDWISFERSLKTENRYFNRYADEVLAAIFEGIDRHNTTGERPIIVEAGPGTNLSVLYRARVFQSEATLKDGMKRPDIELGPPPSSIAIAGRMNAAGVAVFYGATDPGVALAEVRPPVGSKVLVACFEVIRPLRLLDLEALESIRDGKGSYFDPDHVRHLEHAAFLRGLSRRISKPVMPNDEPRDLLPTQAVADFLAAMTDPALDGVIYRSVQVGEWRESRLVRRLIASPSADRRNVVLFQKAAGVQPLDLPEGADTSVFDGSYSWTCLPGLFAGLSDVPGFPDHGAELEYTVHEEVPVGAPHPEPDDSPLKFSSLEVHVIDSVRVNTRSSPVRRYRSEGSSRE